MPLVTSRSVVLQTYRYSDTSKILRLMTRDRGPLSAIARGALRPRSRFGGLLEPFAEGVATLYVKENRDLHTLSAFELVRERQALGADLVRFTGASVLCELVMRLAPEHRDDRLYAALVTGLNALLEAAEGTERATALRLVWRLVAILGFGPDLSRCLGCGRPIPEGEGATFDFPAGGLRCGECAGRPTLSPEEVATVRTLAGADPGRESDAGSRGGAAGRSPGHPGRIAGHPGRIAGPQGQLLADFIRYHLAEGSRLRSLDFLREMA